MPRNLSTIREGKEQDKETYPMTLLSHIKKYHKKNA